MVPLVDLHAQHAALGDELRAALDRVIRTSSFILGDELDAFEVEAREYFGVPHAIGLASGTDALHLALRALGIGEGDEVILPSFTFVATATAVHLAGATPVFADIDPTTFHLDPVSAGEAITERTRALLPVHLYGQPVALQPLRELAQSHGLRVIEDACQAHGARDGERRIGTLTDAGCFSFYPSKNLGCLGDGGLLLTRDAELADRVRRLRHHGQLGKHDHQTVGFTARLDGLQAAFLRAKLPHLDAWNERRRQLAERYTRALADLPLVLPHPTADHVYHLYVVRSGDRDALADHLRAAEIQTGIHYPQPVHRTEAFAGYGGGTDYPQSDAAAREVLSLPMFPELSESQQATVISAVRGFFG